MNGAVVLLSAGLDSTVNLLVARNEIGVELALTFDYGQVSSPREVERAELIAKRHSVPHRSIEIKWLSDFSRGGLVDGQVPQPEIGELQGDRAEESAKAVWVSNRNGVFVNIAAAVAEGLGVKNVVTGFNAEEATTFPDNSKAYVEAANEALSFSTLNKVKLLSFTQNMTKREIVGLGEEIGIPWDLIWVCYLNGDKMCGRCESCMRLKRALGMENVESRLAGMFYEE